MTKIACGVIVYIVLVVCFSFSNATNDVKKPVDKRNHHHPKRAFITLLHPSKDRQTCEMLSSLHRTLNNQSKYRHILLMERLLNKDTRQVLLDCSGGNAVFYNVSLANPISSLKYVVQPHCGQFSIGYRRMCNFLSRNVALHPSLDGIDMFARVDDDSFFWGPQTDVFDRLGVNDYGYRLIGWDGCQQELARLTRVYADEWNLKLEWRDESSLDKQLVFYNNFFVARRSIFTDERFANYMRYLDSLGGIWTRRWGDHAIQTAAAAILDWKVVKIFDFGYRHQGATSDPGTFKERQS